MSDDRLAALLHELGIGCMEPFELSRNVCLPDDPRYGHMAMADILRSRGVTVAPQPAHPGHCITCDGHLDDPYHGPEPCLLCPHAFPHHEFRPVTVAPALDVERLARALGEVRGIRQWRDMENLADDLAASEGPDTYASQDADTFAQRMRREVAAAIAAAYAEEEGR